jgi:hypothetical protein
MKLIIFPNQINSQSLDKVMVTQLNKGLNISFYQDIKQAYIKTNNITIKQVK